MVDGQCALRLAGRHLVCKPKGDLVASTILGNVDGHRVVIGLGIQICSKVNELHSTFGTMQQTCNVQRSPSNVVLCIEVGSMLVQQINEVELAFLDGEVQWSVPLIVTCIDIGAVL